MIVKTDHYLKDLKEILNPPSETLKASILVELREDEGRLEHNLKLLETWISCQSHLPNNYDKNLLITFLRGCKHDLQRTKKKLEHYFMAKTFDEVLYGNRVITAEHDLKLFSYTYVCSLPKLTADGCRIIVSGLWEPNVESVYDIISILRGILMTYDLRLHADTLIAGDVYIFDGKYATPVIIGKMFSPEFRRVLRLWQTMYPIRIRQVHFFNTNSIVVKFVNLIKQFLSEKLARRVFIHSDLESLYKEVPRSLLPSDFGGEQKSSREIAEEWKMKVIENKDFLEKLDGVKVIGPMPKQFKQEYSDDYGAEGSFRKLDID